MSAFQAVRRRFESCRPLHNMTLDDIKQLDNHDLLELYSGFVRVNHYDPFETPLFAQDLYKNNVRLEDIASIVLNRMKE